MRTKKEFRNAKLFSMPPDEAPHKKIPNTICISKTIYISKRHDTRFRRNRNPRKMVGITLSVPLFMMEMRNVFRDLNFSSARIKYAHIQNIYKFNITSFLIFPNII